MYETAISAAGFTIIAYIFYYVVFVFTPKRNRELQLEEKREKRIEEKKMREVEKKINKEVTRKKEEKEEKDKKRIEEKRQGVIKVKSVIRRHKQYVDGFCRIAEREVSGLDEWGDEDWGALPRLKKECIVRIAMNDYKKKHGKPANKKMITDALFDQYSTDTIDLDYDAPEWVKILFSSELDRIFHEYHKVKKARYPIKKADYNKMSGIEFENYIGQILKELEFSVSGTPKTGDQGADLILEKDDKTYVLQLKRYSKPVGNKAVQEVFTSKAYYNGDIAAVVTNSSFTPAAKKLARRNGVILIRGNNIPKIESLLS